MKTVLVLLLAVLPLFAAEEPSSFDIYNEVQMLKIKAQEKWAKEDYMGAAKLYKKAARKLDKPVFKADMLLKEAECYFEANKTHRATEAFRALMKDYALYIPYDLVVDRLRILAERYVDGNGTFWGIRDRQTAIDVYFLILTDAPSIHVSLADRLRLAELLKKDDRAEEAIVVYQDILKMDPTLDDVRLTLAQLLVELCKRGDGDGSLRRAANRQAKMILDRNPDYSRKSEVELILVTANEVEATRMLELGQFYLRPSHLKPSAAKVYLQELIQKYPGTNAAFRAKDILDNHPAFKEAPQNAEEKSEGEKKEGK
ncbi:MAG: tetratricopeptide repeat protein [Victivallales bacterium]|nr:tetratricopeptide repeat protein [Victivallales bacterium]